MHWFEPDFLATARDPAPLAAAAPIDTVHAMDADVADETPLPPIHGVAGELLAPLLHRPAAAAAPEAPPPGAILLGTVCGFTDTALPRVRFPGCGAEGVAATTLVPLDAGALGRTVALAFAAGSLLHPVVLGCLWQPPAAGTGLQPVLETPRPPPALELPQPQVPVHVPVHMPVSVPAQAPVQSTVQPASQAAAPPVPTRALAAVLQDPLEAVIDGRRVQIDAAREICLRCGKASLTLTADGQILMKGAYISSHSTGTQRIKGAAVKIN